MVPAASVYWMLLNSAPPNSMSGILTLVFDDGYSHILEDVVPILDHYGIPGVFAIPLDESAVQTTEGQPTTPWQEWLPLAERGHEIAAHGIRHTDLTTLDDERLSQELREPIAKLKAATLVYPGGAYNDRVVGAAADLYQAARTVQSGFEQLTPIDPYRLHTTNYSRRNWSLTKANLRAWWAVKTNRWLIETFHIVSDNREGLHTVPLTEFKRHVDFIMRHSITVKTIHAVTTSK